MTTGPTRRDVVALRTRDLVGPHGYTLSITGAFTMTAAERGLPGVLAAYLFVVGASLGMAAVALASRVRRLPDECPASRPLSINPVPLVAGPAGALPANFIPIEAVAYTVAGAVASAGYALLYALVTGRRRSDPE
ncbi:hypothetical protein [Actinomycetospora cinnamomea]|uniref:hypothetical protein n=1 Tax=Actinomycetospora cinnamomea TaxID=663609 RepID=UPI000E31242A|nr:hypothetical protein [Actinomycetospora cinnamomea]